MEWRDIKGYEGLYKVSNTGLVMSLDREVKYKNGSTRFWASKILKLNKQHNGYYGVRLSKGSKVSRFLIHRLVIISFIGNEPNKDVNHIDGDKSNNNISNLEWLTKSENTRHAIYNGLIRFKSKKIKLTKEDKIYTFDSIREAQRTLKINNISKCISGKYKKVSGYTITLI